VTLDGLAQAFKSWAPGEFLDFDYCVRASRTERTQRQGLAVNFNRFPKELIGQVGGDSIGLVGCRPKPSRNGSIGGSFGPDPLPAMLDLDLIALEPHVEPSKVGRTPKPVATEILGSVRVEHSHPNLRWPHRLYRQQAIATDAVVPVADDHRQVGKVQIGGVGKANQDEVVTD